MTLQTFLLAQTFATASASTKVFLIIAFLIPKLISLAVLVCIFYAFKRYAFPILENIRESIKEDEKAEDAENKRIKKLIDDAKEKYPVSQG